MGLLCILYRVQPAIFTKNHLNNNNLLQGYYVFCIEYNQQFSQKSFCMLVCLFVFFNLYYIYIINEL